jgi:hypothetical protein
MVLEEPVDLDVLMHRERDFFDYIIPGTMICNAPDVMISGLYHIRSTTKSLTYTEPGTGIVTHRTRINILGHHPYASGEWTGWIEAHGGNDMRFPCIEYINQDNHMFTFLEGLPYKMFVDSEQSKWWCADIGQTNKAFGGEVKDPLALNREPWITLAYGASVMKRD